LSEVIRLTEGEIGKTKFDYEGYFKFLARHGYVDILYDRAHDSKVFGGPRNYRLFLPRDYESSGKSYPVIYYFHGHSDRYTLERYDNGTDTVPKIPSWVGANQAIVVAMDGYVARDYTGFYGGTPYDVRVEAAISIFRYFGNWWRRLDVSHPKTLTPWDFGLSRAASWSGPSARYPDLIGSASSFSRGGFYGSEGARVAAA
jgi:hypothetical protein